MKLLTYINYFYFLLDNWDFKIAWYMIRQELRGERKYGINTTGVDELLKLEKLGIDISHATIYMPVNYALLEEIFRHLDPVPKKHFLDMGSGKGRALCMAAHYGFSKLTGVDISKELCETAKENLALTKQKIISIEYEIINNDAFYFEIPEDADCIFLFNPFDEIIMSGVVQNILTGFQVHPRKIIVIYVNPLHKVLFLNAGFRQTRHFKKMKYIEAVILELEEADIH